jgi:hypothetical protein
MRNAELHLIKAACMSEEVTLLSANSEDIEQMEGRFESRTKRREVAQILIILPHSWMKYKDCRASYHTVRFTKEL